MEAGRSNVWAEAISGSAEAEPTGERGDADGDAADDAVCVGSVLRKQTAQQRETVCSTRIKILEIFAMT